MMKICVGSREEEKRAWEKTKRWDIGRTSRNVRSIESYFLYIYKLPSSYYYVRRQMHGSYDDPSMRSMFIYSKSIIFQKDSKYIYTAYCS